MIPVRVPRDASLHTVGGVRPPVAPTHPLANVPCPVCDGLLTEAPVTLVYVGVDPETHAEDRAWRTGAAVAVHAACAGLAPDQLE
jgi:hypothetical protein